MMRVRDVLSAVGIGLTMFLVAVVGIGGSAMLLYTAGFNPVVVVLAPMVVFFLALLVIACILAYREGGW